MPMVSICWLLILHLVAAQSAIAGATQWVDIDVINRQLLVETEIAGISGHAIIDTGSNRNGINSRFLEASNLSFPKGEKVKISGAFETSYRNSYQKIPVKIFGREVDFVDLVEVNLRSPKTQLILGAGFLQLFIFQFDYPNQRMRAITHDSLDLEKLKNVESKKDPRGGSPIVKVRLNDEIDVWLVMDTGSGGGVLVDRSFAKKKKWLDQYSTVDGFSAGANSSSRMQRFNLPGLTFGGFEIENPIVSVPVEGETLALLEKRTNAGSRLLRRPEVQGVLGYDVLRHFVVTIDYRGGHVHIEPGSSSQREN